MTLGMEHYNKIFQINNSNRYIKLNKTKLTH